MLIPQVVEIRNRLGDIYVVATEDLNVYYAEDFKFKWDDVLGILKLIPTVRRIKKGGWKNLPPLQPVGHYLIIEITYSTFCKLMCKVDKTFYNNMLLL